MKEEEEKEKKKLHNTNFIDACNNAVNGILYATTTQSNVRKQLVIAVTVMILSLFYNFTTSEFLCLTFAVFLVIFAEMINTAIETVVDLFTDQYHPKAKIAKDVAAGAVVLVAINACVVAYFLFFRETELSQMGTTILDYVVASPMHIAFVGIILAVIGILAGKAYINHKKQVGKRIFNPSGQTILAFAILTAIWLNTRNIIVFDLALVLSCLVIGNRMRNDAHSFAEVMYSSTMGVLIILLLYGITIFRM